MMPVKAQTPDEFEFDVHAIEPLGKLTLLRCMEGAQAENPVYKALIPAMRRAVENDRSTPEPEITLPLRNLSYPEINRVVTGFDLLRLGLEILELPNAARFCAGIIDMANREAECRNPTP